jgi:uncharacterized protein
MRQLESSARISMKLGNVVVAGGTGFVGTRLIRELVNQGARVTVLTRAKSSAGHLPAGVTVQPWAPEPLNAVGDDWVGWQDVLAKSDAVISLCGAPVVTRWTEAGKRDILDSRTKSTAALAKAIAGLPADKRPKAFVSTSAIGYYGVSDDAKFTESSTPARNDFLADVSVAWEEAALPIADLGVRLSIMRVGVVMGVGGGALARMIPAFKVGRRGSPVPFHLASASTCMYFTHFLSSNAAGFHLIVVWVRMLHCTDVCWWPGWQWDPVGVLGAH